MNQLIYYSVTKQEYCENHTMVTKIIGTTAYMKKYARCVVNTTAWSQHS